jgi:hypothetical protein
MVVIDILQTLRTDAESLLGHLDSGASRIYEITTAGAIVERTGQLRELRESVAQQLARALELLRAAGTPGLE